MNCPKCEKRMSEIHVYYTEDLYHCSECREVARMSFCPSNICPNTPVLKDKDANI